ncbi:MAG TPA: hypothetical protein VFV51_03080 [Vicinamibacterales bacterium]|nr:hypothetical protein [Vicinamibacterales bacterium]
MKPPNRQIVAAAMFFSAIVMFAVSMLFFTGAIDVGEDLRVVAGAAVAIAAAADLIAAVWFFRQGQSS